MGGQHEKRDERRLAENEVIFRQVNQDVDGFLHDVGVQNMVVAPFFCECSSLECKERIELAAVEYEHIHRNPTHFIVIPGHEVPAVERIVEHHDGYNVVEKLVGLPAPDAVGHRLKELK